MQMVKVYDADGKHIDSFNKARTLDSTGVPIAWNDKIKFLNRNGYYIKGQVTKKGVKIK
jgi:hypothetical protein